ncbi:MAG: RHS repeat-associated core domain-containing protein [Flavobacteriaceae bacterium]|nr:RHS repeat-associated core domain-containing protein [Flavobacteriaceae bacterium]
MELNNYYPFGMPMPNRNLEGNYRYKFQGQEKDPETGMEAFELRLWDSRIGRWLTTDPAGQFNSPYLGMGNNPINGIDPDGGKFVPTAKAAKIWEKYKALLRLTERGREYIDAVDADENWIVNVTYNEGKQPAWSYDDVTKTLKLGELSSSFKLLVLFVEKSKWAYHHSATGLAGHEVAHAYLHWWYDKQYGNGAYSKFLYTTTTTGLRFQRKTNFGESEKFAVHFQNYIYSVFTGGDVFRNEYNGYLDYPIWGNPTTETFNLNFERINFGIPFQNFDLPRIFSRTKGKDDCSCN